MSDFIAKLARRGKMGLRRFSMMHGGVQPPQAGMDAPGQNPRFCRLGILQGCRQQQQGLSCLACGCLPGVVAAHPFVATLTGDASLRRRPMRRVVVPLERMGARIETVENRPPLTVHGGDLRGIDVTPEVPSAQVKSAILLAGLQATGTTVVREPASTRDHTELALEAFGVRVTRQGTAVGIQGLQRMSGRNVTVPGDLSSAAFWAVAAAALPGSELIVEGVGLNATRTAVLGVLARAGARVEQTVTDIRHGEPVGRIVVRHERLESFVVTPAEVPLLIDELPALAALAAFPR